VGGFLEEGETGFEACRRESKEELGVATQTEVNAIAAGLEYVAATDPDWVVLGRFRVMSNRGGGHQTICLNMNAVQLPPQVAARHGYKGAGWGGGSDAGNPDAGNADGEAQELFQLGVTEAREALMAGMFKEIKWTASLSISLLYLQEKGVIS